MIKPGDIFQKISVNRPLPVPSAGLRVVSVRHGCTCTWIVDQINSVDRPGPEHMHIVACRADIPVGNERKTDLSYHTFSVREDGRIFYTWPVWDEDDREELILVGHAAGAQLTLL